MGEDPTIADVRDVTTDPLPPIPQRWAESHKGDFGVALLIGGSQGMSGAIALAALAALRGGAGRVSVAVPAPILPIVAGYEPSYMTVSLPADSSGRLAAGAQFTLGEPLKAATAVGAGPGWGQSDELVELIAFLWQQTATPLVIDADGLNNLATVLRRSQSRGNPRGARILTPHPGEFARLTGESTAHIQANRRRLAVAFAREHGCLLVLKGHCSVITDGFHLAENSTGNPALATGGSGDVLTGLITALLAQGMEPFEAARLGAYLHGRAGELGAERFGQVSLIASDLIDLLPVAFSQ